MTTATLIKQYLDLAEDQNTTRLALQQALDQCHAAIDQFKQDQNRIERLQQRLTQYLNTLTYSTTSGVVASQHIEQREKDIQALDRCLQQHRVRIQEYRRWVQQHWRDSDHIDYLQTVIYEQLVAKQ